MQLLFHYFCLMESWSYGSEAKGFVLSEEIVSPTDVLARSKKVLMGWDLRTPCNYDNTIDNQGFMELSFPDITRKPLPENPIGGFWGSKISNGRMAVGAEDSVLDSNGRDSSLIDLKLGRLADYRDAQNGEPIKEIRVMSSSAVSPMPTKRARIMSLNSQAPLCQVHGCNIDLSSSKDYHKRHKVCEIHSKTAKVIVNGIEQRFCQQCSRFHLLAEFDDGKRSCRKRLAGHNERRRKPQLDSHTGKNGKFLSSYHGIRFLGTSFPTRIPFICPDIYPSGIPNPVKCETNNWGNCVKLEDGAVYSPQSEIPISNRHLLPKSFLPPFDVEKQYPSLHSNSIDTSLRNIFYENKSQYPHDLAGSNSISRLHFRNTPSGNEDFTDFNATSIIQGSSRVSDSVCALSLLSSQSQHSSSQSSGIPMSQNLIPQGGHAHYSVGQFSEKLLGVSSQGSTSVASNRFSSSGMNSVEVDHMGPVLVSDASDVVDFELHTDGIFQGSNIINDKDPLSHEHEPTIDLLQLSSQLQHVERRRHSMQLKQENDVFCYLPIT